MKDVSKLGFGSLRLEKDQNNKIDTAICKEMLDRFLTGGGKYIEVAWAYPGTEEIIGGILRNYDRDRYILTDKMPVNGNLIKTEEDYYTVFNEQLSRCGVSYFDYYLLHNLGYRTFQRSEELGAFRFLQYLKDNGLAKAVGFSFHDTAAVLEEILAKYSELIDVVQLQINYLDWESPVIQSRENYETARKYNKDIFVMEPIKGGRLIALPDEAKQLLKEACPEETPASIALRFPASLENVRFVLSGMTSTAQVDKNLEVFKNFKPLTQKEREAANEAARIIHSKEKIACTACGYCEKVCPKKIPIPKLFHLYENDNKDRVGRMYVRLTADQNRGKASDCIRCGRCEQECSQRLPIRQYLAEIRTIYEPSTYLKNKIKRKMKTILSKLKWK